MSTGRSCGNCQYFIRIKKWGGGRNGMCNKLDYNCHTSSPYAKYCKEYKAKRYNRKLDKQ